MQAHDVAVEVAVDDTHASIVAGRAGSAEARGKIFQRCRDYLLLVAEREVDLGLCGKLGASDLVQQTFLDAERGFGQFRGQTEQELIAWLRRILQNRAGRAVRQYRRAAKRDVRTERPLAMGRDGTHGFEPIADVETPSQYLVAAEERDSLALALSRLPDHYRQVIQLRNTDRKSFEEIGESMGRSTEAVRKLWVRAIEQLRVALDTDDDSRSGG